MIDDTKPIVSLTKKKLSIINVLKEGWQQTVGLKLPVLWVSLLLTFVMLVNVALAMISLIPLILLFSARQISETTHAPVTVTMGSVLLMILVILVMFVIYFLTWFVNCMLIMLGVRKSIGLKPIIKNVYKDCKTAAPAIFGLFLIIFLMTVITYILQLIFDEMPRAALYLNIIVGAALYYIGWSIATFAVPLVVTRHFPTLLAFKTGLRAMNLHWMWVISTYLIMLVLIAISAIPLGIGLFWTLPMMFAINGIFFRDIFGLQKKSK